MANQRRSKPSKAPAKTRPRSRFGRSRLFLKKYRREHVNALSAAVLSLVVIAIVALIPPTRHWIGDRIYDITTSDEDKMVDDYLGMVEGANIWGERPPTMLEASEKYFRGHVEELNPQAPHRFKGDLEKVEISTLVAQTDTYAGRLVEINGIVRTVPNKFDYQQFYHWVVQIQRPREKNRATVYALLSTTRECHIEMGEPISVEGLVVAAGTVEAQEGGLINVAYMISRAFQSKDAGCHPPFIFE
jgi:hypothetical protein